MSNELGDKIASIVRRAMHSNPEEGPFRHRESERSLIAADAAQRILALVQPAIDAAVAGKREVRGGGGKLRRHMERFALCRAGGAGSGCR